MAETYPTLAAGQRVTASLLRSMQPQWGRKTSDTSRTATTTLADDPHLSFEVAANGVYECTGWIKYDGPSAADLLIGWTIPTGADGEWYGWGAGHSPVIAFTNTGVVQLDTASSRGYPVRTESLDLIINQRSVGTLGVGVVMAALISVTLRVGSTGGTFALKWSQQNSDASPVTVYTDSVLRLDRIA